MEAAQLSATQALELTRKVKAYEENLQSTQSFLQDPLITATKGKTPPDLEIRKAELAAQIENRQRLAAKSATTSQFVKDAKLLYSPIRSSATAWEQIIAESKAIIHLADLATAHNRQINRVPLDIWVLMRRFEAIVTRANMHLQEISNGRYELIRSEEGGRVKKTGLGLSIIDRDGSQLGDITRSTTSLSGGETFYTSLALALALAEIVQEESGGVRIDTLIIDEGFGTLSAGIRDLVLHTLHDLQKNGRKIGIVSHVPELKQLIANRIAITAEKSGESTIQVIC
ncbi:SbcC/MukB-like Walker B domain-containing protein [Arcanobacterium hippocoleae]|uniref:SbcC/MukB-like Walker B domain-containing protein n=1 Tax=Arcanobacterium hippocoleae TaxID=149017 RepID=UPI00333F4019